jgi:hypothetical protein
LQNVKHCIIKLQQTRTPNIPSVIKTNLMDLPISFRPLRRPIRRWMDNVKTDLGEIGWDGMDYIELAQDRDQ